MDLAGKSFWNQKRKFRSWRDLRRSVLDMWPRYCLIASAYAIFILRTLLTFVPWTSTIICWVVSSTVLTFTLWPCTKPSYAPRRIWNIFPLQWVATWQTVAFRFKNQVHYVRFRGSYDFKWRTVGLWKSHARHLSMFVFKACDVLITCACNDSRISSSLRSSGTPYITPLAPAGWRSEEKTGTACCQTNW